MPRRVFQLIRKHTHPELVEAIDIVKVDIDWLEKHLDHQDDILERHGEALRGIYVTMVSTLCLILCSVIGLLGYFLATR